MDLVKKFFSYNNGKGVMPDGHFRISASQVSHFFDKTSSWYREHLLGEEGFKGSTATELGNCVHAAAAMRAEIGSVCYETIETYIDSLTSPEIDTGRIREQYPVMVDTLLPFIEQNMPTEVEKFVYQEILPGIGAGGSIDALRGRTVVGEDGSITYPDGVTIMDWKTTSSKTPPTKFSRNYWFQQHVYAWVLKQQGIDVRWLKLVYITQNEVGRISEKTHKPLKDYPSQVSVVTEQVTEENLELVGSCLKLIAESVQTWNKQPELRHLLAQDMRLAPKPKPVLFKKESK